MYSNLRGRVFAGLVEVSLHALTGLKKYVVVIRSKDDHAQPRLHSTCVFLSWVGDLG